MQRDDLPIGTRLHFTQDSAPPGWVIEKAYTAIDLENEWQPSSWPFSEPEQSKPTMEEFEAMLPVIICRKVAQLEAA